MHAKHGATLVSLYGIDEGKEGERFRGRLRIAATRSASARGQSRAKHQRAKMRPLAKIRSVSRRHTLGFRDSGIVAAIVCHVGPVVRLVGIVPAR
jgi:hypothetical protein